jgi:hypothetical protein
LDQAPTSKAGAASAGGADGSAAGAGGAEPGDAVAPDPASGSPASGGSAPANGSGGSESTVDSTGSGGTAGNDAIRRADDCFHYCAKRVEAGCIDDNLSIGDCVDVACGVYESNLPANCKDAWAAYYTCRLANADICSAEGCLDPAFTGYCP